MSLDPLESFDGGKKIIHTTADCAIWRVER